ncbi:MAG: YggS family pyridoxal phosphate-dependent enzyme [Spirochaeta sp.]
MSSYISEAYHETVARVAQAAVDAGRDPDSVRILLATKTVDPEYIREAIAAGADLIGENRIQEALSKQQALHGLTTPDGRPVAQHFIGHLQSNKIKDMLGFANMLHSLDRRSLAVKLNNAVKMASESTAAASASGASAPLVTAPFPVLIQVNTSGEQSKFGAAPEDAQELVDTVLGLPHLDLKGFMTIGLFSDDEEAVRRGFRRLREIRDLAESRTAARFPELSMGMSGDFKLAIAEGATIVRIGSVVFGRRS